MSIVRDLRTRQKTGWISRTTCISVRATSLFLRRDIHLTARFHIVDQEWKHSFYSYCLSPVLDAISQPKNSLDIPTVLDLDRRIRDFPVPDSLRKWTGYESRGLLMQKGAISTALEAGEQEMAHLRRDIGF